jgi:DNA-binding SARP family transcriptional activator
MNAGSTSGAGDGGPRVRLLGPVELTAGDRVVSIPPLLRVLIAALALADGRVVPAASLVEAMWGEELSGQRERNLHVHVYQLRRLLAGLVSGADRRLVTRDPGYLLLLEPQHTDVAQFTALAGQGRDAARSGDHQVAVQQLGRALALWRGVPLADVTGLSLRLSAEAERLEEQRLAVTEDLAEARMALGEHRDLISELRVLASEHPLRERVCILLMLALYRDGRQAEALERYRETRQLLADQLGLDPSRSLQELHQQILQADPRLWPDNSGDRSPSASTPTGEPGPSADGLRRAGGGPRALVPRQLPAGARFFAGRDREIKQLTEMLDAVAHGSVATGDTRTAQMHGTAPGGTGRGGTAPIAVIGGIGGIGKSALALHFAHQVAWRFPDGQLHANLRGYDPSGPPRQPADVLTGFIEALGVPATRQPRELEALTGLYRTLLADRRMLIVLDNAADPAQVRPLVPTGRGCLVLVTSRSTLTGLVIDGASPLALDTVTGDEAMQILTARLGPERTAVEARALARLTQLCGRLPLALAIVAARAASQPELTFGALADELASPDDRLDVLDTGEDTTSVQGVFSWSCRRLSESAARMFRLLGLHCGPDMTLSAAASLSALPRDQARAGLVELTAAGLITEHRPGRYTFHDLLRAYAIGQARRIEPESGQTAAIRRSVEHYLHSVDAASRAVNPHRLLPLALPPFAAGVVPESFADSDTAVSWQRTERQVLIAAVAQAATAGLEACAWQLATEISWLLNEDGRIEDCRELAMIGLAAAERAADVAGMCWCHLTMSAAVMPSGDEEGSLYHDTLAADLAETSGDLMLMASTQQELAISLASTGRPADGVARARKAVELFERAGSRLGQAKAMSVVGALLLELPDIRQAEAVLADAAGLLAEAPAGSASVAVTVWRRLGRAQLLAGHHAAAAESLRTALDTAMQAAKYSDLGSILLSYGRALRAAGDEAGAQAAWQHGLAELRDRDYDLANSWRSQIEAELSLIAKGTASPTNT